MHTIALGIPTMHTSLLAAAAVGSDSFNNSSSATALGMLPTILICTSATTISPCGCPRLNGVISAGCAILPVMWLNGVISAGCEIGIPCRQTKFIQIFDDRTRARSLWSITYVIDSVSQLLFYTYLNYVDILLNIKEELPVPPYSQMSNE
jgi:hypothetical protein